MVAHDTMKGLPHSPQGGEGSPFLLAETGAAEFYWPATPIFFQANPRGNSEMTFMLRTGCWAVAIALSLASVQAEDQPQNAEPTPGQAQPTGTADKPPSQAEANVKRLVEKLIRLPDGLTLSEEQQTGLESLRKAYGPRLLAVLKAMSDVITPEQKQAAATARAAAIADGKEPAEVDLISQSALGLTAAQRAARQKVAIEQAALRTEVVEKLRNLLTPEQRAEVERRKKEAETKGVD